LISVVIPVYNEKHYIAYAIQSVIGQTAWDEIREVIIIDDGSTDGSERIIRQFSDKYKKVKYVYQQNRGLARSRNAGINLSKGKYIAFLDADDIWRKEKIEKQLHVMLKNPDIGLLYSDLIRINSTSRKFRRYSVRRYNLTQKNVLQNLFIKGGPIIPSTVMVKKACFYRVGNFDPKLRTSEDMDMWLRIAAKYPLQHLPFYSIYKIEKPDSLGSFTKQREHDLFRVIDKIASLYPELKPYKDKRKAKILTGAGYHNILKGSLDISRKNLIGAIKLDIYMLRAYFYYLISYLPQKNIKQSIDIIKSLPILSRIK
jgi:glycosyltransferase involved in cell wall biosynthesis